MGAWTFTLINLNLIIGIAIPATIYGVIYSGHITEMTQYEVVPGETIMKCKIKCR